MKKCTKCMIDKAPTYPGGYQTLCKKCTCLHIHNMTSIQYEEMLKKQNSKCAICNIHFEKKPHIDHCHSTGKIRGLLCMACNTALGSFRDSVANLNSAVQYLTKADGN